MTTTDRRGVVFDSLVLAIKTAARAATTANITRNGLLTIDGVALAADDRVLVKDQTDARENGVFNASTGNWTRCLDVNSNEEITSGELVAVVAGTTNGGAIFVLTTEGEITLDTTALTYQRERGIASRTINDSAVPGATVADALEVIDQKVSNFASVTEAAAATIENITFVRVAGFAAAGDGGAAIYKFSATQPAHAGKFQSADGAWWELAEDFPTGKMFDGSVASLVAYAALRPSQLHVLTGGIHFRSGQPWADVRAFGALANGGDDTAAIMAAIVAINALGGGVVFFPPGLYASYTGISTTGYTNIAFKGCGILASGLWSANHDVCILKLDSSMCAVSDMVIYGKGSNADAGTFGASSTSNTLEITNLGVGADVRHVYLWNGYYPLKVYADDVRLDYVLARGSYGPANLYVRNCAGVRMDNSSVDDGFLSAVTSLAGAIPARQNSHAYSLGDVAKITVGGTDYVLQITTAGTSAASAPTAKNYGVNVTDGTAVWQLVRALVKYGIQLDTGASEFLATKVDISGTFESGVKLSNTLAGTAPFLNKFHQCIVSGMDAYGFDVAAGGRLTIADSHILGTLRTDIGTGIYLESSSDGSNLIHGCILANHLNGLIDGKGTGTVISGNHISVCSGVGLYAAPNVSHFTWLGNNLSVSNGQAYQVDTGTSDYYTILGNEVGSLGFGDTGSGTHKYAPQNGTSTGVGAPVLNSGAQLLGGTHTGITGLGLRTTGTGAFDLKPRTTENLTADRNLTINMLNADRTLSLGGNISIDGNAVLSGAFAFIGRLSAATDVTFPPSGTLLTQLRQILMGNSSGAAGAYSINTGTTGYIGPSGGSGNSTAQQARLPVAGTFKNLYITTSVAPGGSESYMFTLQKNGVDTALTTTVSASGVGNADTTHSVAFAAGDLWQIKVVSSAGAVSTMYASWGIEFDA